MKVNIRSVKSNKVSILPDHFAQCLLRKDHSQLPIGLHVGQAGIALYLAYYARHSGKEQYLDRCMELIQECFGRIADENIHYSLCSGIAGTAWTLAHLSRHGFFEADPDELLRDLDASLLEVALEDIKAGQYDLLHSGLGVGVYFLERLPGNRALEALSKLARALIDVRVVNRDLMSWPDTITDQKGPGVFNLGLAHGVPGIIGFLSLCLEVGVTVPELPAVVEESIRWLLQQELPADSVACYAHRMKHGQPDFPQSRLAWCYGDLGVARSLWMAGRAAGRPDWQDHATRIARKAARRDKAFSGVRDAGFCHGTAGIAYIFQRFFHDTQLPEFKKAADHWYDETRQFYRPEESGSGFLFQFSTSQEDWTWREDFTLLNGLPGVGMAFLAMTDEALRESWDRCFLLS